MFASLLYPVCSICGPNIKPTPDSWWYKTDLLAVHAVEATAEQQVGRSAKQCDVDLFVQRYSSPFVS